MDRPVFVPMLGVLEIVILLISAALFVWPAWRICRRAGFPGSLGLLAMVPVANLVLLYILAFAPWPALEGKATVPEIL